jgi:hypothetical protein
MDALAVRAHLVRALEADLIGPFRDDEILHQRPGRWYLTGFLVPYGAPMGALEHQWAEEEFADEEVATNGPAEGGDDDGDGDGRRAAQPPRLPSSFGLTVLVPAAAATLGVSLRWGQYHVESRETPEAAAEGEAKPERRESWWQRVPVEVPEWPVPVESGLHSVPGHADLWLMVRVRPAPEAGAQVVSVFLSNRAKKGGTATHDTRALFQAQMKLHCAPGFVPRTSRVHEASDDLDQRRADLQYRNHAEWGVGHGVSAAMEDDGRVVSTSWLPRATVSRMKASGGYGVTLDMEVLAAMPDAATLQADLAQLLPAYLAWMEGQRAEGVALGGDRADIAQVMMDEAARAHARIAEGIALLGDDAVFRAFRFTCDAMARSARKARPGEAPRWRLFQLAFLLLNLPSLADPGHDDRTTVELLFFPTGGGKTEAYLGVATFAQVLRRLRHRTALHQGAGVAVLLRYTLRLLTLDQLQRAATLTCALELIRRENPGALGDHPFSIGLWVGNKATPNTLKDARDQHASHRANPGDPRKPLPCPLTFCPWCGTPFSHESLRFEGSAQNPTAMHLECRDKTLTCPFGAEYGAVPLEWVDEQIYRRLPGFLVGTVDKFALLPWRGEAGALFGKVWGKGQGGYVPASQKPASGGSGALPGGLPPPELIIQDELHLITGPLGTLVGLYEAAIDGLCRDAQGHGPKIVASTATARRAGEQIKGLFGRGDTALFPPPGVNAGDMFFAQTDEAAEKTRLYVGVGAPGRNQKALMVRVYSTLLSAAYRCWQVSPKSADAFNSLVAYFNTLRELGGAARLVREEVAPRAGLLEIRRAVQDADGGLFRKRELGLDVYELTSRLTTDQIRKAKDRFAAAYKSEVGGRNDVLLASSMISVGVDIPRLGLMVMNGQPRTVAEYIQATSRVGRETPGLVVTLHNLYRPRDRSHYERFTAFHEAFYRDVEAASVTPFSPRAVDRGLAGALVALARHRWPTLSPSAGSGKVDAVAGLKESLVQVFKERAALGEGAKHEATTLEDWLAGRVVSLVSDWSTLVNGLLQKGVQVHYSPWETQGRALLRPLDAAPDVHHPLFDHFRAPTSMRDVEPEVDVWLNKAPGEGGHGQARGRDSPKPAPDRLRPGCPARFAGFRCDCGWAGPVALSR